MPMHLLFRRLASRWRMVGHVFLACVALVSAACATSKPVVIVDRDDVAQAGFRGFSPQARENVFSALALPAPGRLRTASGVPGPDYWQQQADYAINATLDATNKVITATSTLTYTNNSPEQLDYLWFHLEQNLYRHGSAGEKIGEQDTRFVNRANFDGGFEITSIRLSGDVPDKGKDLAYRVHDAVMRVDLPRAVGSRGGKVSVEIAYSFPVPEYGSDRMGIKRESGGDVFEIAQWFPAVCKYDDVHGWNTLPYLGQGEFYTDFGSFDVKLTVPREHIVAATGVLQNPLSVLTQAQIDRLNAARQSADTVQIVSPEEVGTPASRPAAATAGPTEGGDAAKAEVAANLTWHFKAERVRTFAWASSRAFIWDAAFAKEAGPEVDGKALGTLCMSMYPKEGLPLWGKATQMLRFSIEHYGEKWFKYPYPVATNINGIVGGMEYPMIIFCEDRDSERALFGVTTHEIGHNWFPMTVNTDERRHAWMDEGFNTFINQYSVQAWFSKDKPRPEKVDVIENRTEMTMRMLKPDQQPMETPADQIIPQRLGFLAYRKVGVAMVLLREVVLGPDRFDPAFRRYISSWAFKSPQPADFFRCMEDAAGIDLAWFWRGWFLGTGTLDQAVDSVSMSLIGKRDDDADDDAAYAPPPPSSRAGDETPSMPNVGGFCRVEFSNRGEIVMPLVYRVSYTDGSSEVRTMPVEGWFTSDRVKQVWPAKGRKIARVEIDPDNMYPDIDLSNNVWPRKP